MKTSMIMPEMSKLLGCFYSFFNDAHLIYVVGWINKKNYRFYHNFWNNQVQDLTNNRLQI